LVVEEVDLIMPADMLVVQVVQVGLFMEQYQVQHLHPEHILLLLVLVVLVVPVEAHQETFLV
jgi:hypothetical protein